MTTNVFDQIKARRAQLQREHDERVAAEERAAQEKLARAAAFAADAAKWILKDEGVEVPAEWVTCEEYAHPSQAGSPIYTMWVTAPDGVGRVKLCHYMIDKADGIALGNTWGYGKWEAVRGRASTYFPDFIGAADYAFPDPPDQGPEPKCPLCGWRETQGHEDDCINDPRNQPGQPIIEPDESDHFKAEHAEQGNNLAAWHLAQVGDAADELLRTLDYHRQQGANIPQAVRDARGVLAMKLIDACEVVDWRTDDQDDELPPDLQAHLDGDDDEDDPNEKFLGVDAPNPYTYQPNPADLEPDPDEDPGDDGSDDDLEPADLGPDFSEPPEGAVSWGHN